MAQGRDTIANQSGRRHRGRIYDHTVDRFSRPPNFIRELRGYLGAIGFGRIWGGLKFKRTVSLGVNDISSNPTWFISSSCVRADRRYIGVRNYGGEKPQLPNLLKSLRGLENRPGRLPRLGHDPGERALPHLLLESLLGFEATQLPWRFAFYDRGE